MLLICYKSSIFFANKKVFGQKFADFKIYATAPKQFRSRSLAE